MNYKKFNLNLELTKIFTLKEFVKIIILDINIDLNVDIKKNKIFVRSINNTLLI